MTAVLSSRCSSTTTGRPKAASGRDTIAIRDLLPAVTLLLIGLAGLLAASLSGPGLNGQYLVMTAPWSSFGQTIDVVGSADGGIVEAGRFANIVIAISPHTDFAARARQAGAWLVLPSPRTAGCFSGPTETSLQ